MGVDKKSVFLTQNQKSEICLPSPQLLQGSRLDLAFLGDPVEVTNDSFQYVKNSK